MITPAHADDTLALTLRPDVVATVLDEGGVLLDLESKYFYAVNATGWAIVELLEAGATPRDVAAECARCGAPSDGGVYAFIEDLERFGLLEVLDDAAAPPRLSRSGVAWIAPTVERQSEPLEQVIVSAFDPSIPLAE